ncbi:MAG: serpin family protein [Clostridiales bacterium]|nr:serpin family protein [Candidatus Crickella caballi]
MKKYRVMIVSGFVLAAGIAYMLSSSSGVSAVEATDTEKISPSLSLEEYMVSEERVNWSDSYCAKVAKSKGIQTEISEYESALMEELLVSDTENTVCSPINTYFALALLAEVTGGETRQQILDVLNVKSIDALRSNIDALWKSNCVDTPAIKSLLANSVWLNNAVDYNRSTLNRIAESYHASSFEGTPGSKRMDRALRDWTDEKTGGLLSEYTKGMSLNEDMVVELVSTVYLKAIWQDAFAPEATSKEVFHGASGDTAVDMMHATRTAHVYRTDNFAALELDLTDSGSMYVLLPEEGVDVNELAADRSVMATILKEGSEDDLRLVNMSIPKFKVSSKLDLTDAIRALGITDALDPAVSDYSPLTDELVGICLDKAEHAAMIDVDEDGVTGAAYTELGMKVTSLMPEYEEVDFVVDRPFMFVITGADGAVLFSGIERDPLEQ